MLRHNHVRLALHTLRAGEGRPLLLLHGLGERAPTTVPLKAASWPSAIYALDFTGHGASTIPSGGGYTCELLMADVDAALAHLGRTTVVGRGLGGYVALLIAGARPDLVRGAIVRDGPGLAGGGSSATSPIVPFVDVTQPAPPDPFALVELATDLRPRDYAASFARQAAQLSGLARPISVCAREKPGWLAAAMSELDIEPTTFAQALAEYAEPDS
ncbi:MAG TPA: alpha/beta hydrolase [Polyangiales bacterium]|jgi:pimeloyl-ACP methyl ester carboxylesterase|nr:alpha/beta hydrolase [Polyangiales bacterium]